VPGEATLWPSLTGAETLHLLASMHGETDVTYRDLLIKRFDFDISRKVRTYSKGNRQKINLIAALALIIHATVCLLGRRPSPHS
jgi:polyether ionophore transport system ATP-binding protein